ncbi:MAG TPA: GyrI-like domain-containing protein [Chitinophaga sp.]|nr:GyrI-like domain-containing protein [Chitinophaga sp.]
MTKLDLTKVHKELYAAGKKPQVLFVPAGHYLSIKGKGDPDGAVFAESVQALYTAAYSIKAGYKKTGQDFTVCKLEGIWWVANEENIKHYLEAMNIPREEWYWQLLIRMPDFVVNTTAQQLIQEAYLKKGSAYLKKVSLTAQVEGKSVQVMHNGPYATEPATIQLIVDFMEQEGLKKNGRHHEIYLSDPRKTAPEKLKTILRQPVK